jgi:uncharacterized protein (DUF697 family)/GTP-binding protein EngB required for normal cell division
MANKYEDIINDEWEKFKNEEHFPNIMLLGETGCGKSSLINLVFGKEIAPVKDVYRGTERFEKYYGAKHGISVNLIDSRGYEMENGGSETIEKYQESIKREIRKSENSDPSDKIHIVWYCISCENIEPYDINVLNFLLHEREVKDHVAIVLTKCDEDDIDGTYAKEIKKVVRDEVSQSIKLFKVSTDKSLQLELNDLISWSADVLEDDDMRKDFVASQMINLDTKRIEANRKIGISTAEAAVVPLIPVAGIADSMILVPIQVKMSAQIVKIYGMDSLGKVSTSFLQSIIVSTIGKTLAAQITKLIPVVGKFVNAAVASALTSAIGFSISEICYGGCKRILNGENVDFESLFDVEIVKDLVEKNFKEQFKNK